MEFFLLKKIDSIFIPYLFFSLISIPFSYLIPHDGIFNGPLWFLQTLFVALTLIQLAFVFTGKDKRKMILLLAFTIGYTAFTFYIKEIDMPFHINRGIMAATFILLGYILKDKLLSEQNNKWVIISTTLFVFATSFSVYYCFYPIEGGSFVGGGIASPNLFLFYLCATSASMIVIYTCKAAGRIGVINWFGRNSLVIMCVHFPLVEYLNKFVSTTSLYINGGVITKTGISITIVVICLCYGALCALLCKKYIPNLTSYKRNFNKI